MNVIALARAELVMLARNRVAVVTGILVPVAAGGYLITNPPPTDVPSGVVGGITSLMLVLLAGMTLASTATTTLVARRQQHLLERWQIAGTRATSVLAGTLAPVCLLAASGAAILFAATGYAFDTIPARPELLVLAVALSVSLGSVVAVAAAAFTRSVGTAEITLLPVLAALIGGGIWTSLTPLADISWRMRATGGGALTELVRLGWDGPADAGGFTAALSASAPSLAVLVGLVAVSLVVAVRNFRWNPRA
ncbi:hypothetical protein [Egibacter rhizosphaerae]|uniref:hypothetical protein n=1 Tax=Egibacter rhizosphaerae TaxID=1670831 RepID=UPI0013F17B13|nr:hypothetical protein [Egibacter rhizosphaerae]